MTENLIGKKIHGIGDGATCGTLLALIAGLECFATILDDFREKGASFLAALLTQLHCLSLNATEASSWNG